MASGVADQRSAAKGCVDFVLSTEHSLTRIDEHSLSKANVLVVEKLDYEYKQEH